MDHRIVAGLVRCPFCSDLPADCIESLVLGSSFEDYATGDILFRSGESADRLFVVIAGHVVLYLGYGTSESQIARIVYPGETFAEAAVCGQGTYPVTAEVVGPAQIATVSGRAMRELLGQRFDLVVRLLGMLSVQLRGLIRQITNLKMKSTAQRLGSHLLNLAAVEQGPASVRLPYPKRLLAQELGMQPETLSRAFAKLQGCGVKAVGAGEGLCSIDDVVELRRFCDDVDVERCPDDDDRHVPTGIGRHRTWEVKSRVSAGMGELTDAEIEGIRQTPIFSGLRDDILAKVLHSVAVERVTKNHLLFSAGDPADHFYIILKGAVTLFVLNAEGGETIIEIVEAGSSFAEGAMFASGRFPVSAEAAEDTHLIRISRHDLFNILGQYPGTAMHMLAALGQWQLHLMGELWQLKARTPAQRFAWFLLTLAAPNRGTAAVELPYPKNIVASRIGITPESLSRALVRLADLGVDNCAQQIVIADVERLRRFCGA